MLSKYLGKTISYFTLSLIFDFSVNFDEKQVNFIIMFRKYYNIDTKNLSYKKFIWGYYGTPTFLLRNDSKNWSIKILDRINIYSGITISSDHFPSIFFEVRGDVIFSQSEVDCPVIFCPVIPNPHCSYFILVSWK